MVSSTRYKAIAAGANAYPCAIAAAAVLSLLAITCVLVLGTMLRRPSPVPAAERALLNERRIFIAANYYNNEDILPAHFQQMLRLIAMIRAAGGDVFVSFYENGSKDSTPAILGQFREMFRRHNVLHRIVSETIPSWRHFHDGSNTEERIKFMAKIRNRALEPLSGGSFDDVLFFNDVIFDADDAIRLLLTEKLQYDVVCAMDFNRVTFYDTWVSRDINGFSFSRFYPYASDEESASLLRQNRPFPVTSCWNGVVAMKAAALSRVQFRSWRSNEPRSLQIPAEHVFSSECPVSECALLFKDLAEQGYSKFYINPAIHVTYSRVDWALHLALGGLVNIFAGVFLQSDVQPRMKEADRIPSCVFARNVEFRLWTCLVFLGVVLAAFVSLMLRFRPLRFLSRSRFRSRRKELSKYLV